MEMGTIDVVGDIDELNDVIIKSLGKFGEFPEEVGVVNRVIVFSERENLLRAYIIYIIKNKKR